MHANVPLGREVFFGPTRALPDAGAVHLKALVARLRLGVVLGNVVGVGVGWGGKAGWVGNKRRPVFRVPQELDGTGSRLPARALFG